jgi:hypothetical protein
MKTFTRNRSAEPGAGPHGEVPKVVSIRAPRVSWEEAIVEAEDELQRARLLVRTLEEAIVYFRGESRQAIPASIGIPHRRASIQPVELCKVCSGSVRPLE